MELLARHCYVQLGASVGREAVQGLLPSCVPPKLYRTKPPEQWAGLVTTALAQVSLRAWLFLGGGAGGGPPSGHRNLNFPVSTALGPQVYPGPFHQRWSQARPTRCLLLSWHRGSGWLIPLVSTAASVRARPSGTEGPHLALPWPSLSGSLGPGCLGPALILPTTLPGTWADSLTQGGRPAPPSGSHDRSHPSSEKGIADDAVSCCPRRRPEVGGGRVLGASGLGNAVTLSCSWGAVNGSGKSCSRKPGCWACARHSHSSDRHLGSRAPLGCGCCSSA